MKPPRIPTSHTCYDALRGMLILGQLPAGSRLAEIEWSQRLEVHRPALREAMGLLAHEGLLKRGARGGFFVPLLERRDFEEIREARLVIETGAIRLMERLEPDAGFLEPLSDLCETMRKLLDAQIVLGFIELDHRFHETLVELSGNTRLIQMYQHAALPILGGNPPGAELLHLGGAKTVEEHREIHSLLVQRRYGEAIAVLERHLGGSPTTPAIKTDRGAVQ